VTAGTRVRSWPLPGLGGVAEAEFIDVDGTVRREPLCRCWGVALERVAGAGVCVVRGSGTGRDGGGSLARASSWVVSRCLSVVLTGYLPENEVPEGPER
jgi:hypothetical protein